jgi:flagellar hook-basal body complex protein FliE
MSFDLGNILGSVAKAVMPAVLTAVFPPLGLATSLGNMLTQQLGGALGQAAKELTESFGMPKFIAKEVSQLAQKVLGEFLKPSDSGCDQEVQDRCGNGVRDFGRDMMRDIVNNAVENMRCGGDKKKGSGSWFEALAEALGKALDKQAAKIEELSGQITDENAKDKPSTMTQLQAATQKLSFMMSSADNILKTLGEANNKGASK